MLGALIISCNGSSQGTGDACASIPEAASSRLIATCEGCEAVFEHGSVPMHAVDTLPDFDNDGPRIKVTGIVYKPGGQDPACGVIVYVYHTNQEGIYAADENATGWGRRHGRIRGWARTGPDGRYTFYTLKPGTYPSREAPAHIHVILLEPDGKYYWIEEYVFAGDPLLNMNQINRSEKRGGSNGIVTLRYEGDLLVAERDIELGKNILQYR